MKKIIRIIFLIGVLVFIFFMSSKNAFESSVYNVELVKHLRDRCGIDLYGLYGNGYVDVAIRKLGHFFEFSLLSAASYLVLSAFRIKRATILTIVLCIFFGGVDEFHQLYVQGRSSSLVDVAIDSMGAIMTVSAISLVRIIRYELLKQEIKYVVKNNRS